MATERSARWWTHAAFSLTLILSGAPATAAEPAEEGGPVIIMAPQDITGSIRKADGGQVPVNRPVAGSSANSTVVPLAAGNDAAGRPQSLIGIPTGVYLQRN